ncbi:Enterobactin exporter EntS [bacterium HR08]|nr:Enterobactin exporter EntS [bacterium HR08]
MKRPGFSTVFRNRGFRTLWLAQAVSGMGNWLAMFALLNLGGFRFQLSAGALGGMAALFFLTLALIFPLAGAFVDRASPRRVMIVADSLRAGLMALLWLAWEPSLIYLVLLLAGGIACFFLSAQMALLPSVVEREELLVANAVSVQTQHANGILAPLLAGALIARLGERPCFALNGLSFLFSALCLSRLAPRYEVHIARTERGPYRPRALTRDLRSAFGLFRHDRTLVSVMGLAMLLIVAASAVHVFGIIYVRDVLRAGPHAFGSLLSALGAGMAIGIWLVGRHARVVPRLVLIRASAVAIGLGLISVTWFTRVLGALIGAFLMGVAAAAFLIPAQTLVQERTPAPFLGRMSGLLWSLVFATQALSVTLVGGLASVLTLPSLYRMLGMGLLVLTGLTTLYARRPRRPVSA